eukprot:6221233-Amphidinium_carterae.1
MMISSRCNPRKDAKLKQVAAADNDCQPFCVKVGASSEKHGALENEEIPFRAVSSERFHMIL